MYSAALHTDRSNPSTAPGPEFSRAAMCRAQGMLGEAVSIHEALLGEGPLEVKQRSRLELARDFKSAGMVGRAIAYLTEALETDPDDAAALEELEEMHVRLRDWTGAIRIRQSMPRKGASLQILAHEWAALGRDTMDAGDVASARFAFETSIRISPQVADGYVGLGDVLERQGRPEAAARLWTRALRLRPDVGAAIFPRLSGVLEPARLESLLCERAKRGDRLAALWLARMRLDGLPASARGDGMGIWARLERIPGGPPLAGELARRCAESSHAGLADEIRLRLEAEIGATRIWCVACGASAPAPWWLCPLCLRWEDGGGLGA